MITPNNRIKYLTNKDLLAEIHNSKKTYSEFIDKEFEDYDIIVTDLKDVTKEIIENARNKKFTDHVNKTKKEMIAKGIKNPVINYTLDDVPESSIVIRLMTFDHIPINEEKIGKAKTLADKHMRCNFPPFQHFIFKDNEFICVGKSHWKGGMENGEFCVTHGRMTNKLGMMFMTLVERYSHKGNWRGYCVHADTEALTDRGWLKYDEITESDKILSYNQDNKKLIWSNIKSIYRGDFDGLMYDITSSEMNALITPNHKLVTDRGLVPIEYITAEDNIIMIGDAVDCPNVKKYSDSLVELAGWIITEGNYEYRNEKLRQIRIWQNMGPKADRIRNCLNTLSYKFHEGERRNHNLCFGINRKDSKFLELLFPNKNIPMHFLLDLTRDQRELLLNTLVDGDGCRTGGITFTQKDKNRMDMFIALSALLGLRANCKLITNYMSFGKETYYYIAAIRSSKNDIKKASSLKLNTIKLDVDGQNIHLTNEPTTYYKGIVWCPETEYGSFVVRHNGKVYLTGNSYVDEFRSQAIMQLAQVGLQFDESRSSNGFAYMTTIVSNSFTRVLNIEKKNQNIRDDLLTMNGSAASYTRTTDNEIAQRKHADAVLEEKKNKK